MCLCLSAFQQVLFFWVYPFFKDKYKNVFLASRDSNQATASAKIKINVLFIIWLAIQQMYSFWNQWLSSQKLTGRASNPFDPFRVLGMLGLEVQYIQIALWFIRWYTSVAAFKLRKRPNCKLILFFLYDSLPKRIEFANIIAFSHEVICPCLKKPPLI